MYIPESVRVILAVLSGVRAGVFDRPRLFAKVLVPSGNTAEFMLLPFALATAGASTAVASAKMAARPEGLLSALFRLLPAVSGTISPVPPVVLPSVSWLPASPDSPALCPFVLAPMPARCSDVAPDICV